MKQETKLTIIIVLLIIAICFADNLMAQTISIKPKQAITKINIPHGKTFNLDTQDEMPTTNIAIYKGETYPVYATSKGKLYIKLVSIKTGKKYRKFINY